MYSDSSSPAVMERPPVATAPCAPARCVLAVVRWPVGGIRTYILYHYPILAAAGFRFTFVGPADSSFRAFCDDLRGWDGVEFVEAPLAGRAWRLRGTLRPLLRSGRFDLIHTHGLSTAPHVVLANHGLGIPHVVHSHDVFRQEQVPGLKGRVQLWLLERALCRVDALVSVSHDAQENLLAYLPGLARSRGRVLPILNGIDAAHLEDAGAEAPDLRARAGIGPGVFLIGFLGRFMEQKGFLPLLDALERLLARGTARPFHVAAVGSGDYQREYRAEVERRGLGRAVSFHDGVPNAGPLLRQLDLLVMPSLWEACPLLPMEALAAGVPVLGSDCIGLREVLGGTSARMAPARDAAAWAHALAEAVAQPWTEAARAYAAEARRRFDAARAAEELRQLFGSLIRPAAV